MECRLLSFGAKASEFDQEGWTARERHIAVQRRTIRAIIKIIDQSWIQVVVSRGPCPAFQLDHE